MEPPIVQQFTSRKAIAAKVKALRKGRQLTQGALADVVGLSTSRFSEIEAGKGSFSAEAFLELLRFFNVPASYFEERLHDPVAATQKALARHGALHLVENPEILPSEALEELDVLVRETLVEGRSPRNITALAPVILKNATRINFDKLFAQFCNYGLERRYVWLIENSVAAALEVTQSLPPGRTRNSLSAASQVLQSHLQHFGPKVGGDPEAPGDTLGIPVITAKTRKEILSRSSGPSARWNILTDLQVGDFARAIRDAYELAD